MAKTSLVYGVSVALHGALAVGVVFGIHEQKRREVIAISMAEAKKKEKPPEPPKVEPIKEVENKPEVPRPAKARAPQAAPKPVDAPPESAPKAHSAALDGLPNLGLSMGNDGPGGLAVGAPIGAAAPTAPTATSQLPAAPKVLVPKQDECTEAVVKPKLKSTSQPAPTSAAREAGIEGKVRIEVSVGVDGSVTGVRLVGGLGYGLDEASLEAARHATFQPATRCGKPVAGTLVMSFRFQTQQ